MSTIGSDNPRWRRFIKYKYQLLLYRIEANLPGIQVSSEPMFPRPRHTAD